ncbi:MAG: 5-formyltetrahydrofolate cyclo-ligase [Oscillospiraceae bacterium]|jgi:5-formyltetrahydrofolate cyclo-ligase|nr:5-formyltetrahydrofolate cyclo-ligase [Oscillospiraceae bacterium]
MAVLINEKKMLREDMLRDIGALPAKYIVSSDSGIYNNLVELPEFLSAGVVLFYFSVNREPSTHRAIARALDMGKTAALPLPYPGGVMSAREILSADAPEAGPYGIPAPPESARIIEKGDIDLIIVPAVSFDRDCYRLGYGGGYYDRYLPGTRAYTVGLARERLIRPRVPREAHDIPVRCVVTEAGAIYARQGGGSV